MIKSITEYSTIVFDCDGVLLDSNKVKTNAFYKVGLHFGEDAADLLVRYHVANGGISRYKKFEYFKNEILNGDTQADVSVMLDEYASLVYQGLLECRCTEGLEELRVITNSAEWMVVSGGDQDELRRVFKTRGIDAYFDAGIFGSPESKDHILERELGNCSARYPAIFLGDSRYDRQVAEKFGLDFVFLSDWSECSENEFEGSVILNRVIDLLGG